MQGNDCELEEKTDPAKIKKHLKLLRQSKVVGLATLGNVTTASFTLKVGFSGKYPPKRQRDLIRSYISAVNHPVWDDYFSNLSPFVLLLNTINAPFDWRITSILRPQPFPASATSSCCCNYGATNKKFFSPSSLKCLCSIQYPINKLRCCPAVDERNLPAGGPALLLLPRLRASQSFISQWIYFGRGQ